LLLKTCSTNQQLPQTNLDNQLIEFMIQIRFHLIFMLQIWNIRVVCISCCSHVRCVKHARGYTCENKILELDVLFNINGCSWWFVIVVEDFIIKRGGTNKFVVKFFILGNYLQLKIDVNISLLDNTINYLSINARNHGFL
jgi:hypothetical protein